jgi:hypothetical protein
VVVGLAGATLGVIGAPAASAAPAPTGVSIAKQVLAAANPAAAYNKLTAGQKAAYGSAEKPVSVTAQVTDLRKTSGSAASPLATGSAVSPLVSGCWSAYVLYDWKAAAGNTVYTTWQGLDWCANGSISSWHVFVRGGETSTPGWSYDGPHGAGSYNVGWEVRQYTQEKFTFGAGQYFGYSTTPCTQIRGGATGLYSTRATCNLG